MSKNKVVKKRNWAFVVYPESLPENWIEILTLSGLQIAISPLHDKDKNPDGTPKKPHYHVLVVYNGPTSFNVVKRLAVDKLNGVNPIALEAVRGYYRYLTHEDNPEKYLYDKKEITLLNGFNIRSFSELTAAERDKIKIELIGFIKDNFIIEYFELIDKTIEADNFDWFNVASTNTIFFNSYLTSRRNKLYLDKYRFQKND